MCLVKRLRNEKKKIATKALCLIVSLLETTSFLTKGRLCPHFCPFHLQLLGNKRTSPLSNALNVYLFKSSRRLQDSSSDIPKLKSTGTNQMPMDFALCKKKVAMSRYFSLSRDNHVILTRHILLIRSTKINTYSAKM